MQLKTIRRHYQVDRSQISFLKFVLEAYDNVASVSTVDPQKGIITIVAAPGCETLVDDIIADFAVDFTIRRADGPPMIGS